MPGPATLDTPRVFPPKMFYLIVWLATLALSMYGMLATPEENIAGYIWLIISAVAAWQVWTTRWVQIDSEGIRVRNILHRGRALQWSQVSRFHEEEVRLNKGTYVLIRLSNEGSGEPPLRPTKITITSDQIGFDTLRELIKEGMRRVSGQQSDFQGESSPAPSP